MKNNQAWVIIGVVLIVAIGAIWYMTHKVTEVPSDEVTAIVPAQGTVKGGTQTTATKGTTAGTGTGTVTSDIRPKISSITPSSGKTAAVAQIKGMNFDSKTNVITFGPSLGLHRRDGSADNEVATIASSDGKTLSFSVPTAINSGELCDQNNQCKIYGPKSTAPGTYMVTVVNKNGVSNEMPFVVTAN